MKKLLHSLFVLLLTSGAASFAQTPFSTRDSLDINNLNALALVHGDMWWNPITEVAHCHFPASGPASVNFVASLWMSGYDGGGNLHIAAQTYRQDGNDYWPGPLDASDTLTYTTSHDWAKIWKVNRSDIDAFLASSTHTTGTTPLSILTWPGKGNTYAQGNSGVALTVSTDMAPFVDVNGNGVYEPLSGDYPDIKGDQALWWVFSDNGPSHHVTQGRALGVEVHAMAYGFHRGTLIDNVAYYEYTVTNKSARNYSNFRIGLFDDVDLGYAFDDYIGFDSARRMGICYNGYHDDGATAGHPANSYGTSVPVVGVTMISMPGDMGGSYAPVGSFVYYNNDNSVIGNPAADTEYNHYLRGRTRTGLRYQNDFTGRGHASVGLYTGPYVNYVYTGDPQDTTQWSECNCNNSAGDRRFILSSNDFTLSAGATEKILMALVVTDTGEGGCPSAGFSDIKRVADTAWGVYETLRAHTLPLSQAVNVYPNPAHDRLYVDDLTGTSQLTIFNVLGQQLQVPVRYDGRRYEANVGALQPGLYYVICKNGSSALTCKFVKE